MRLWSIHPKYLDSAGLVACWRESLLAQSCLLKGEYSKCDKCDGTGYVDNLNDFSQIGTYFNCKKCKGTGKVKTPYYNHSQLERFKNAKSPIRYIGDYLLEIANEAEYRGYKFNKDKIKDVSYFGKEFKITQGQIEYEFEHLLNKLEVRAKEKHDELISVYSKTKKIEVHPLFKVVEGDIEKWEKVK